MAERPDAMSLLEAARASVIEDLLPRLDEPDRASALMVAKALSITSRELAGAPVVLELPAGLSMSEEQLRDRLRAGELVDEGALRAALLRLTRERLRISSPKLLATLDSLYGGDDR